MKKVQGKKKRDAETADAARRALEAEGHKDVQPTLASGGGGGDILGGHDEDVIAKFKKFRGRPYKKATLFRKSRAKHVLKSVKDLTDV